MKNSNKKLLVVDYIIFTQRVIFCPNIILTRTLQKENGFPIWKPYTSAFLVYSIFSPNYKL